MNTEEKKKMRELEKEDRKELNGKKRELQKLKKANDEDFKKGVIEGLLYFLEKERTRTGWEKTIFLSMNDLFELESQRDNAVETILKRLVEHKEAIEGIVDMVDGNLLNQDTRLFLHGLLGQMKGIINLLDGSKLAEGLKRETMEYLFDDDNLKTAGLNCSAEELKEQMMEACKTATPGGEA